MKPIRRVTKSYFMYGVKKYKPLILMLAGRLKHRSIDTDEMVSYGLQELLKAMICFDQNLGCSFTTFLYNRLFYTYQHLLQAEARHRRMMTGTDLSGYRDNRTDNFGDTSDIEAMLSSLTDDERYVVKKIFLDGSTLASAAAEIGTSITTAYRKKEYAIEKLAERYNR